MEAARRGEADLSLVSIDSAIARAHHDAAGTHLDEEVLGALERPAAEAEKARSHGAASKSDKRAFVFHGTVTVAAIRLWIRQ